MMNNIVKGLTAFLAVSATASALGSYEKLPGYISANQVVKSGSMTSNVAGKIFGGACMGAGAVFTVYGWFEEKEESPSNEFDGELSSEFSAEASSLDEQNDVIDLYINDNDQNVMLQESNSKVRLSKVERALMGFAGGLLTVAGAVICFVSKDKKSTVKTYTIPVLVST